MWDCYFELDIYDHILNFNGLSLENAKYEPDFGVFIDVEFGHNYFISGETEERIDITTTYRGLKGTRGYQVDLFVDNSLVKTFRIQTTSMGDILTPKDEDNY